MESMRSKTEHLRRAQNCALRTILIATFSPKINLFPTGHEIVPCSNIQQAPHDYPANLPDFTYTRQTKAQAVSDATRAFLTIPAGIITAIPWFHHLLTNLPFVDKYHHT
ncbi:hypothetical protein JE836_003771 [Escherichia coli]|nr:hypothetical protein [Escherichia coli]